jgi:protein-L-isoaspartate O-methyltransferase
MSTWTFVERARERVAAAGVGNVEVVLGDGALGYPAGAPYDRIVATVGAYGVPDAWLAQLAPTGRLVVPARVRGSVSRSRSSGMRMGQCGPPDVRFRAAAERDHDEPARRL